MKNKYYIGNLGKQGQEEYFCSRCYRVYNEDQINVVETKGLVELLCTDCLDDFVMEDIIKRRDLK